MAKKASAKASAGTGKSIQKAARGRSERSDSSSNQSDMVDALIRFLQSPLVIDLLAVGATAALAAITESRSSRAQGVLGNNKRTLKAAVKAAAAAVGRRIASEFDEIREASRQAGESRKATADAEA